MKRRQNRCPNGKTDEGVKMELKCTRKKVVERFAGKKIRETEEV